MRDTSPGRRISSFIVPTSKSGPDALLVDESATVLDALVTSADTAVDSPVVPGSAVVSPVVSALADADVPLSLGSKQPTMNTNGTSFRRM
jgi:hypothetical protein